MVRKWKQALVQMSTFQKGISDCHIGCSPIEVLTALKAASIKELNIVGLKVTIYIDSQAALKVLTGHLIKFWQLSECKASFKDLNREYNIRLC